MARLVCPETGEEASSDTLEFQTSTGGLYDVLHSFPTGLTRELFDNRVAAPRAPGTSGVWRFKELVDPDLPSAAVVSLCEGNTPLYTSPQLSDYSCIERLWLKHEGANPTGSFKDRGMTVAVSRAVAAGAEVLACASTGNTAASLAAYSARAGVRAVILVPESSTATGKLSQAVAYGARTLRVRGGFDVAMNLVRVISLFYVGIYFSMKTFDIMHHDVWQAVFIILSIFAWALWAVWAVRKTVVRQHARA